MNKRLRKKKLKKEFKEWLFEIEFEVLDDHSLVFAEQLQDLMMNLCDSLGGICCGGMALYKKPVVVSTCFDWYRVKYSSFIPSKEFVQSCKNKIVEAAERFILENNLDIKLIIGEIK